MNVSLISNRSTGCGVGADDSRCSNQKFDGYATPAFCSEAWLLVVRPGPTEWSPRRGSTLSIETFEIVVRGRLSPTLMTALGEFEVTDCTDGLSRLVGSVPDQSRLHGLFHLLRDLNIELISVNPISAVADHAALA
jgi:hypothetical protein